MVNRCGPSTRQVLGRCPPKSVHKAGGRKVRHPRLLGRRRARVWVVPLARLPPVPRNATGLRCRDAGALEGGYRLSSCQGSVPWLQGSLPPLGAQRTPGFDLDEPDTTPLYQRGSKLKAVSAHAWRLHKHRERLPLRDHSLGRFPNRPSPCIHRSALSSPTISPRLWCPVATCKMTGRTGALSARPSSEHGSVCAGDTRRSYLILTLQ